MWTDSISNFYSCLNGGRLVPSQSLLACLVGLLMNLELKQPNFEMKFVVAEIASFHLFLNFSISSFQDRNIKRC
nr:hypothetical protein Iba_chr12bCG2650 [Ipomoea batatas]GMD65148.1 hypothetical protein Iba_chr12cCG2610 [Ipomoea batatas]GMD71655.1 hypothetical protein Iba_chr12fCG0980 [Ipomoea batatas]